MRIDAVVILVAFDLLELDGKDLRREPLEVRKAKLARREACSSTSTSPNRARSSSVTPASLATRAS
jgi:ATP-dependent DNA ligase